MIKRIHSNLFYASDLEKTETFYKKLGFNVKKDESTLKISINDFTLCFIDENKTEIKNESGLTPKGLGIYTYVQVDDVDAYYRTVIDNGIKPRTEPKTWDWGKREFVVKDPDGYKLVFFSPVK